MLSVVDIAHADGPYQALGSIRDAVKQYVLTQLEDDHDVEVEVSHLDPRLRLPLCAQPLEAFFPPGHQQSGNTTVGIRCNTDTPWALYVPVKILSFKDVVVTANVIGRNEIIQASQLKLERRDTSRFHRGYFVDPVLIVGKQATRALGADTVLTPANVKTPDAVKRGQRVTLLTKSGVVEVRMAGTALANGAVGERIQVENLSSKRILQGKVTQDGVVNVNL